MKKSAIISECGKYRYKLSRHWDESKPAVMFVMLNPSTADAEVDDPTIRRCIAFAKSWGFGSLHVCNLFAYRATSPKELLLQEDPIGEENLKHLRETSSKVSHIVCAWGNWPIVKKLERNNPFYFPCRELSTWKLNCIELTIENIPKHPLYLKLESKMKAFDWIKNSFRLV